MSLSTLNPWNHYHDDVGGASLWTGFGVSFFASVVLLGISLLNDKPKNAVFTYLTTVFAAVTALAYLIMALGNTEMFTVRPLLWVRYVQWAVQMPIGLSILGLLAGTTVTELAYVSTLGLLTIGSLFAAAISSGYNATWPIFAFGVCTSLPVFSMVLFTWMARASHLSPATKSCYNTVAWLTAILGLGYVINWGTAEGGKVQSIDQEIITYTVLDVVSKPIAALLVVFIPNAIEGAAGLLGSEGAAEAKAEGEAHPTAV